MLKRLYIDNYKCLVNFELKPEPLSLWLGGNGAGKSSVFQALSSLQRFLTGDSKIDEFSVSSLTRWQTLSVQQFELEIEGNGGVYQYDLQVEHNPGKEMARVKSERLLMDKKPLFEFANGTAQLYHDDFTPGPQYPFDWTQSGVAVLQPRHDNTKLTWFRERMDRMVIVAINPFGMATESRKEEPRLTSHMENFVGWYRRQFLQHQRKALNLLGDLTEVIEGFDSFSIIPAGEDAHALRVKLKNTKSRKPSEYRFGELSEGQRVLIALYSLLHFAEDEDFTLCIDEPENFIALPEIQPWLTSLHDRTVGGTGQAILISHHPELVDYLAAESGHLFTRGGESPTRVKRVEGKSDEPLKISELIARGWLDEQA